MGRSFKKIYAVALAVLCMLVVFPSEIGAQQDSGGSVILTNFKLPEYNKDTKLLDYVIYGDEARTFGVKINLSNVKVNWVENDIEKIKATIETPTAVYDRATKMINGDREVFFKSQSMDAEGIGFDADYDKQLIHIRSNVKVVLKESLESVDSKENR